MSTNQQQRLMPGQLKLAPRNFGGSRLATFSTVGLIALIVAVFALLARDEKQPSHPAQSQNLGAIATQNNSTPAPISTPLPELTASVEWEIDPPLTHASQEGKIVISGDRAFQLVTFDSDDDTLDFSGLRALDLASGEVLWQQNLAWSRAGMDANSHGVYSVADLRTIDARDPDTGDSLWTLEFPVSIGTIALDNDVLYVWDTDSSMSAVNTTTGKLMWQSDSVSKTAYETTPDGVPFSADLEFGGGVVVAMDADSMLHAFSLIDGTVKWTFSGLDWQTSSMYTSGDILLAVLRKAEATSPSRDQHAIAIDMFTGNTAWEVDAIAPYGWSGSSRADGRFYVVAASLEGAATSSESIADAPSSIVWPDWTPTAAERQSYFDGSPHVFALDAATGQIDWRQSTGAGDFYGLGGASSTGIWAITVDQQIVLLSGETGALVALPVVLQGQSMNGLVSGSSTDWLIVSGRGGVLIGVRINAM